MRPGFSWRRLLLAAVALIAAPLAAAMPAMAQGTPVAVLPIYFPHTKSYFELRTDLPKPPQWRMAERVARTKSYKGVRGRLAVVPDIETHSFLQANFPVYEEAWIGLRFICSVRKLVWVDGEELSLKAFKMWAKPWHRSNITCQSVNIPYMPIHYLPQEKGFRWQASGPEKYFHSYFVEYQTGKE